MSHEMSDPFAQMQQDWQQTETPTLHVDGVRRRLRWRWLYVALEVLVLLVGGALIVWAAGRMSGLLDWVYWGFFAAVFAAASVATVQWRLGALLRPDDSVDAVIDHARRDARIRAEGGRLGIWMSAAIGVFVFCWMIVVGWQDPAPLGAYLGENIGSLIFAVVWCLLAVVGSGWMRERALRQLLELDYLDRELRG